MTRALVILNTLDDRQKAARWIARAPYGTRIEFKKPRRSLPQNDKMWACLTDIADQLRWHGMRLTPDDWKLVMLDALKRELRVVPNIDGTGFVNLGRSSSDLSKEEMSDLIELIHAFGATHGVAFQEPPPSLARIGGAGGESQRPSGSSPGPIPAHAGTAGANGTNRKEAGEPSYANVGIKSTAKGGNTARPLAVPANYERTDG